MREMAVGKDASGQIVVAFPYNPLFVQKIKPIGVIDGTQKFIDKKLSEINDSDIKDYPLHLAEEKQSATSPLKQAINALKFYPALLQRCWVYYGTMLKFDVIPPTHFMEGKSDTKI